MEKIIMEMIQGEIIKTNLDSFEPIEVFSIVDYAYKHYLSRLSNEEREFFANAVNNTEIQKKVSENIKGIESAQKEVLQDSPAFMESIVIDGGHQPKRFFCYLEYNWSFGLGFIFGSNRFAYFELTLILPIAIINFGINRHKFNKRINKK